MATNPKAAKKTTAKKASAKRSPKAKGTAKPDDHEGRLQAIVQGVRGG